MPRLVRLLGLALLIAGCRAAGPAQISESGSGAYEVSLAALDDALAVGWYDTRDGDAEVYLRLVDPSAKTRSDEYRVSRNPEQSYEVDIAALGPGLAVAWYGSRADARLAAKLAYWRAPEGLSWQTDLSIDGRSSRNPVVRAAANRIFVAWIQAGSSDTEKVVAAWFGPDGQRLAAPFTLGTASENTWNLNAALTDNGNTAWVAFDAAVETTAAEIYLARLSGDEVELRRLTEDDGHASKYPDIDFSGELIALTWFDERDGNREVYLYTGDEASLVELEARAARVTDGLGESIGAYLAWNGNRLGLAWADEVDDSFDVYFQAFAPDGHALGERRNLSSSDARSLIPAIEPWQSGFAVAWNDVVPGAEGKHDSAARSEVQLAVVNNVVLED